MCVLINELTNRYIIGILVVSWNDVIKCSIGPYKLLYAKLRSITAHNIPELMYEITNQSHILLNGYMKQISSKMDKEIKEVLWCMKNMNYFNYRNIHMRCHITMDV